MISINELRKKFPDKTGAKHKDGKKRRLSKEAIRREFKRQKDLLAGGPPKIKRGIAFYAAIIFGLMILGALVMTATGNGGGLFISKKKLQARKSVDAISEALGRYKFHVGEYPSTEDGLEALTNLLVDVKGWNGPYLNHLVKDPWGKDYVYEVRPEGGYPVLYSRGPDGKMGTTDDIMPKVELFDKPFEDTTWTNKWVPFNYRGILVAPNKATRELWQVEIKTRNFQEPKLKKEKKK